MSPSINIQSHLIMIAALACMIRSLASIEDMSDENKIAFNHLKAIKQEHERSLAIFPTQPTYIKS